MDKREALFKAQKVMFAKKRLGIYLGQKKVSIVEVKGRKIINKYSSEFAESQPILEPEDEIIKKVAFFNEALRESKIRTKDVFVGLSSEDLIIRSFIIPAVPSKEIPSVINFEVKRYIPFPIEELISDFLYRSDRLTKKIEVIFVGIKKEAFKFYDSIFEEIGFRVLGLEPGVFSLLRLLKQRKEINKKDSFGFIDVNEEGANFTIILDGFPFLTRQIKISPFKEEETLSKFHSEVRISLEYLRRQFPGKNIDKLLFLTESPFSHLIEGLEEETGLPLKVLEPKTLSGKDIELNISELKALGLALRSSDPKIISLNLYKPQVLIEKPLEVTPPKITFAPITPKVIIRPLILVSFFIFFALFLGHKRSLSFKRELKDYQMRISSLKITPPFNTISDLQDIKMNYQRKLSDIENQERRLERKITPLFDSLPRLIPSGLWLEELSLTEKELILIGYACLEDEKKEFDTVYKFLSSLKRSKIFTRRFKETRLISVSRVKLREFDLTNFEIRAE